MRLTVTGLGAVGAVPVACDTAMEALEQAVALLRSGSVDVLIADEAGLAYTPPAFTHALLTHAFA